MKKIFAIGLMAALVQIAPLQAQDLPQSKLRITVGNGYGQGISVPSKPHKHRPHRPAKPQARPLGYSYSKSRSLQQAGHQVEQLERRQQQLERELRRAKQHRAGRSQIAHLLDSLRRVDRQLQSARRDYRHFLKIRLGARQFTQLIKHAAWLSGNHRPHRPRH